jgi:hypothetical protein
MGTKIEFLNVLIESYWLVGLWCLTPLSVISWWSVLLVKETGVPGEKHRSVATH